jgi:hypothetical protein
MSDTGQQKTRNKTRYTTEAQTRRTEFTKKNDETRKDINTYPTKTADKTYKTAHTKNVGRPKTPRQDHDKNEEDEKKDKESNAKKKRKTKRARQIERSRQNVLVLCYTTFPI